MASIASQPKRSVFLVDDHALVREWLTSLINQQPDLVVCGEADDARKAMQGIGAAKPDVVVVDLLLKDSSGLELIKDLKRSRLDAAILVLSMHEEPHFAERAMRAGASGYVTKRDASRTVIEAIRKVLAGTVYLSESVAQDLAGRLVKDRAPDGGAAVGELSDRELQIFELIGQGRSVMEIAAKLRLNVKTVHTYCGRIREKWHLKSSHQLYLEAVHWREGLPSSPRARRSKSGVS
jgi:DNA-binding NarL/FixJ family response regulator